MYTNVHNLIKRILYTPSQFCSLNIIVTSFNLFKFISVYHWNIQNIIMPFTICLHFFYFYHKKNHVKNVSFLLYVTSYIRYLNNAWSSFKRNFILNISCNHCISFSCENSNADWFSITIIPIGKEYLMLKFVCVVYIFTGWRNKDYFQSFRINIK